MTDPLPATLGPYRVGAPLQTLPFAAVHRGIDPSRSAGVLLWTFTAPYATAAGFLEVLERVGADPALRAIPGLLPGIAVGLEEADDPIVYLATGDAEGGLLVAAMEARRAPGVFATVEALAATLDALHASGRVHGDVQPANVLLDRRGQPLLTGCGVRTLAMRVTPSADWVADDRSFRPAGTLEPTPAVDRYGLAALTYFLLCGHPPAAEGVPEPPSTWRTELPAATDALVLEALSPSASQPRASAAAFAAELRATFPPQRVAPVAPAPPPEPAAEERPPVAVAADVGGGDAPRRRRVPPATWVVAGALVLLIAAAVVVGVLAQAHILHLHLG